MITPGRRYVGATQSLTAVFRDNGTATDPTTVKARVFAPYCDRSWLYDYETSPELTRTGTGAYLLKITPDEGGRWLVRWEADFASGKIVSEEAMPIIVSPYEANQQAMTDTPEVWSQVEW